MRLGNWDGVATMTAAVALVVLAVMPRERPADLESQAMRQAGQAALELGNSGTQVHWDDMVTGASGSITPLRVFRTADGQWCRRLVLTVAAGRDPSVFNRTACRRTDGEWQLQGEPTPLPPTNAQVADVVS
jgi:surface antigen